MLVGEPTHARPARGDRLRAGRRAESEGQDGARPCLAGGARRRGARRAGPVGRLEAPFVGRDDELRLLKDLFHATTRERRPRLVSVTGQAGIGKSRLAWEFLKYIDGLVETVYWHPGRSPAYGEGITFWALGEMVRRRAGLAENDDEATTRARIAATLEEFVPDEADRRWIEPALLFLLGFESAGRTGATSCSRPGARSSSASPPLAPTVLVFEDLQWADSGLLDFIDHLLDWAAATRCYVVTLARPELLERRPDWGAGRRNFVALALRAAPRAGDARAARRAGAGPAGVRRRARSSRAPAACRCTRSRRCACWWRRGGWSASEDTYRPSADLSTLAVPESLQR